MISKGLSYFDFYFRTTVLLLTPSTKMTRLIEIGQLQTGL